MVPGGWIANGEGGWTSPDGAHWGARERPPLKLANDDKWSQHRALEKREERLRHSNGDHNGSYAFDEEDDGITTPQQRKADHEEWYTKRYGDLHEVISDDTTLQTFVERGLVVTHRCRTYDRESEAAVNRRTPSPCGTHASAESSPPTPDKGIRGVTLGIYGDGPLEVRSGVVAPAGYYIVIDGAAGDQYEAAQGFPTWYGPYGAEHYMWAGSRLLDHSSGSLAGRCR